MKSRSKFGVGEVGRCDPEKLTFAPWNPLSRIDATTPAFKNLVDSIRDHSQIMPVIINQHGLVIEGNRRVAACRLLGKPVLFFVSELKDAFLVYRVVNSIRSDISKKQTLEIYKKDIRALTPRQQGYIKGLLDVWRHVDNVLLFLDSGNKKAKPSLYKASYIRQVCIQTKRGNPSDALKLGEWAVKYNRFTHIHICSALGRIIRPTVCDWLWTFVDHNKDLPYKRDLGPTPHREIRLFGLFMILTQKASNTTIQNAFFGENAVNSKDHWSNYIINSVRLELNHLT